MESLPSSSSTGGRGKRDVIDGVIAFLRAGGSEWDARSDLRGRGFMTARISQLMA